MGWGEREGIQERGNRRIGRGGGSLVHNALNGPTALALDQYSIRTKTYPQCHQRRTVLCLLSNTMSSYVWPPSSRSGELFARLHTHSPSDSDLLEREHEHASTRVLDASNNWPSCDLLPVALLVLPQNVCQFILVQ